MATVAKITEQEKWIEDARAGIEEERNAPDPFTEFRIQLARQQKPDQPRSSQQPAHALPSAALGSQN